MAISDLPEISDTIDAPLLDQRTTNITALVLRDDAVVNPLKGDLTRSTASLETAKKASAGLDDADIDRVRSHVSRTPVSPGQGFTQQTKDDLVNALTNIQNLNQNIDSGMGSSNRLLEHSELVTQNIPAIGSIINDVLSLPKRLTSDSPGGLPSSFPARIPSYSQGSDGLPIPNFTGVSLPPISRSGISSKTIGGQTNVSNMSGVSVPGVPNTNDVMKGFAGSVARPEFGGVGVPMAKSMTQYSDVAANLAGPVSGKITSMSNALTPPDIEGGLYSAPSIPFLLNAGTGAGGVNDIIDLGNASNAIGSLGNGMGQVVGGEEGAFYGASCSLLAVDGGACGGRPSVPSALAKASSYTNMAKTRTSAKLLASVSSPSMAKQFPEIFDTSGIA